MGSADETEQTRMGVVIPHPRSRADQSPVGSVPAGSVSAGSSTSGQKSEPLVTFDRPELTMILALYGRQVAAGEWRDYAIDFGKERAVFSVFRRSTEVPLYRIEKNPSLARKQGAFSVSAQAGMILKRGQDLRQVLSVLEPKAKLVVI